MTVGNQIGQRLFTSSDVNLLTTLAAQAVNAIEKLQLFEQAQRAVNELDAVNRLVMGEIWTDFTRRTASNVRWVGTSDRRRTPICRK